MTREVAIIGLGGGMADAPLYMERWGLPWSGDSSYDRYFEVPAPDVRPYTDQYRKKLSELEVPVVMQTVMEGGTAHHRRRRSLRTCGRPVRRRSRGAGQHK